MDSNPIIFLFLAPLAIIGLVCSYTDIKYGKIFNKWIILSFFYIFFLYLFLFFYNFTASNQENIQYAFKMLVNGIIAFFGSYFLWHFRLWSAGDAKLFAVYAFLIPLNFYAKSYVAIFPSFNLLVNLFIPLLLILTGYAFFALLKEGYNSKDRIKKINLPGFKKIFKATVFLCQMFFGFVFVIILFRLLFFLTKEAPFSEILLNPFFIFGLLLLIMGRFSVLKQKNKWLSFIVYGVIIIYGSFLIFDGQPQVLENISKTALIFMILIGLTRQLLDFYIQKRETEGVKIKDIKGGMVLAKNEVSLILNRLKEKGIIESFGRMDASGINKNQAELIKSLFSKNQELKIGTYKTFPFAPFLFLSAIISVLTQSSFLPLINKALQDLLKLL